jgi:type IV pilus assembly protein PilN
MIRINLLNDIGAPVAGTTGSKGGAGTASDIMRPTSPSGEDIGALDVVIKLVVLLTPLILAFAYRAYEYSVVNAEHSELRTKVDGLNGKMKALEPVLKEIEKFQEEKKKLDAQLAVIKNLSHERLRGVKSLEAIQTLIPGRAWLTDLKLTEDKISIEGISMDDLVTSEFIQALTSSIYFSNVVLQNTEQLKSETGPMKKFSVTAGLGKF